MENQTCIRIYANESQIKGCRKKIESNEESFQKLSKVLDLAANDVRLKILFLLQEEGELCPCDLSDILGISVPAISQHLKKLKGGDIIESNRVAQTIFYSLKNEHLKILKPFFKYIIMQNLIEETV